MIKSTLRALVERPFALGGGSDKVPPPGAVAGAPIKDVSTLNLPTELPASSVKPTPPFEYQAPPPTDWSASETIRQVWDELETAKGNGEQFALVQADYAGCPGCSAGMRNLLLQQYVREHGDRPDFDERYREMAAQTEVDVQRLRAFDEFLEREGVSKIIISMDPSIRNGERNKLVGTQTYKFAESMGIEPYDKKKGKPRFPNGVLIDLQQIDPDFRDTPLRHAVVKTIKPDDYYRGSNDTDFNPNLVADLSKFMQKRSAGLGEWNLGSSRLSV